MRPISRARGWAIGGARGALAASSLAVLVSCAAIQQAPDDPEDTAANLASYSVYFGSDPVSIYAAAQGDERTRQRDVIVLNRMLAFDITYARFRRRLNVDGNTIATGGDLIGIGLTTTAALTGTAALKAALAGAATAVLSAKTAISTDLYYQRTLPALIAQMDANRARAKLALLTGLSKPDSDYPLGRALYDLSELKNAGGLTEAIQGITSSAVADKIDSNQKISRINGQAFREATPARADIFHQIAASSGPRLLVIARIMDGHLSERPQAVQDDIRAADPRTRRETDVTTARQVLERWALSDRPDDPTDSATATRFAAEWRDAISQSLQQ